MLTYIQIMISWDVTSVSKGKLVIHSVTKHNITKVTERESNYIETRL